MLKIKFIMFKSSILNMILFNYELYNLEIYLFSTRAKDNHELEKT